MPASRIARSTPAATFRTPAGRPISSGRDRLGHGDPDDQPLGIGVGIEIVDAREHVDMRGDDAGAPAGQRDRHLHRRTPPPAALANQEIAQHAVDQDTAEIVDPAIALGLGDQRDDVVGAESFLGHCRLDAGGVLDVLHRNLLDDNGHGFPLRVPETRRAG